MKSYPLFLIISVLLINNLGAENESLPVTYLQDKAFFISGTGNIHDSKLRSLSESRAYGEYKTEIDKMWAIYQKRNLSNIRKWRNSHLNNISGDTLFYPFGGPDIVNPLTFFPDISTYILIGLENPGRIMDPKRLAPAKALSGLWNLKQAIHEIIGKNFFITKQMRRTVSTRVYNELNSLLQFFIVRSGYTVEYISEARFTETGDLEYFSSLEKRNGKEDKARAKVLEIGFRKSPESPLKKVIYISANLADNQFTNQAGLFNFLNRKNDYITQLKASSHLMFTKSFDDIRNFILTHSKIILEESSGLPYHYLKNEKWQLKLFGRYKAPIDSFKHRCQPDLERDLKKGAYEKLGFFYGYRLGTAHIILAIRKDDIAATDLVYDRSNLSGENTYCFGKRLFIRKINPPSVQKKIARNR